jgi:hypothetical protein
VFQNVVGNIGYFNTGKGKDFGGGARSGTSDIATAFHQKSVAPLSIEAADTFSYADRPKSA